VRGGDWRERKREEDTLAAKCFDISLRNSEDTKGRKTELTPTLLTA